MRRLNSMQALNVEISEQKLILKQEFTMLGDDLKVLVDEIPVHKSTIIGKALSFLNLDGVVKDTAVRLVESYTMDVIRKKNWNPIVGIAINSFVFPLVTGFIKSKALNFFISNLKSQPK